MCFNDAHQLLGKKLQVKPIYGYGWGLFGEGSPEWLDTPDAELGAIVKDILSDGGEARVLICEIKVAMLTHEFNWSAIIARSDFPVDLGKEPVHCNLMFSKCKPSIAPDKPYSSPEFVTPNSQPYVRGFGVVRLVQN